jgi:hypothetical protein
VRETHSAVVVLLGDRAYKVKKPVDLGFLDFTTMEARRRACLREIELNRRLAPDVYLGLAEMSWESGDVCEHVVVMRRMPEDRRLSTMVSGGEDVRPEVKELARVVAAFHARAAVSDAIAAEGRAEALLRRWRSNLAGVRALASRVPDPWVVDHVETLAERYVAGRRALLDRRADGGLVRDGHGDLLAEDIYCLPDGPRVLDCLEFSDSLRWMDVLDDVACLSMDLERLGAPDLAVEFHRAYDEFSGWTHPVSLWHHYVAYRAFMRAKVTALRSTKGEAAFHEQCQRLAGIAVRHLEAGIVRLVVVGGGPGTGKSALAGALADRLGAVVVGSDRVRKELAGVSPGTSARATLGEGIYDRRHTELTYREMLSRAERLLRLGESVVLDATFGAADQRSAARSVAERAFADLVELRCDADPDIVAQRLRLRSRRVTEVSDADEQIGAALAATADRWPEASRVDTSRDLDRAVHDALAAINPTGHR